VLWLPPAGGVTCTSGRYTPPRRHGWHLRRVQGGAGSAPLRPGRLTHRVRLYFNKTVFFSKRIKTSRPITGGPAGEGGGGAVHWARAMVARLCLGSVRAGATAVLRCGVGARARLEAGLARLGARRPGAPKIPSVRRADLAKVEVVCHKIPTISHAVCVSFILCDNGAPHSHQP